MSAACFQFGYLVLFAPAFPLAPLLAFINNLVEIRSSSYRMVKGYRRPLWKAREGIGTWMVVLNTLGFLAVITNAAMISFVGRQRAKVLGVPDDETDFLHDRLEISALWFNFLAVEHMVMFVRVIILAITPKTPTWIKVAKDTLDFRLRTYFKTNEQKESHRRFEAKYYEKMELNKEAMAAKLQTLLEKGTDGMHSVFQELDRDHSNTLDRHEVHELFRRLEVQLSDMEVDFAMHSIDVDDSDECTFEELMSWIELIGIRATEEPPLIK